MRTLTIFVLFALQAMALRAGVIEKTYRFNEYQIIQSGDYQLVRFPDTRLFGAPGMPVLPYRAVALLLPPGEAAQKIEIIRSGETVIPGSVRLMPGQFVRPLSAGSGGDFQFNKALYAGSEPYPGQPGARLTTAFMNGYGFAFSMFTPLSYIPAQNQVRYYRQVTVRITTAPASTAQKALELLRSTPSVLQKVRSLAQNTEMLDAYPQAASPDRSESYQLLVVTDAQFVPAFEDLRYLYLIRGLKMKIVSTDSIYRAQPAATHKESVRNFIIQEYRNHGIEYVLLGGDVEWVPYCGFYCAVQSDQIYQDDNIPADLYYSALDGTWNDDGDDKWGEIGEDDLLPDVAVARLPFSTADELQRMLHKVVQYQDHPVLGELNHPLLAGENLWDDPLTWGADYMDLLVGHHDDNGYTTDGIAESDPFETLYDRDLYPSEWSGSDIMQKINQGKSFVYHAGHSNTTYAMRLYSSDITDENFAQVDGVRHNFTLVNTQGCDCGAFDYEDCIAEEMVKIDNFAVGFVGNSRYGWFNEGTTEGPSTHLQREFVNAIYHDTHFRIGEAHMYSKIKTSPWVNAPDQHEEGAMRWCFYDCNVLSDPALGIWTEEPIAVQADYPHTIQTTTTSMEVTVTSGGDPVAKLTCALVKDSVLYGTGVTDSLGHAVITIDPPIGQTGPADLIVSGYNCLPTFFPVEVEKTSAIGAGALVPLTSQLIGNFPNPFNSSTVIHYRVGTKNNGAQVRLTVYNALGQRVALLVHGRQKSGTYRVAFDGTNIPTGIYFYRLTIGKRFVRSKKMILLR